MKKLAFVLIFILPGLLLCIMRTVSLDGTQQYISIQSAIDTCINGDIVEVYPGEYFEHLNPGGRSITIESRYHLTHVNQTIDDTIIHSSFPNSCLLANSNEIIVINGFTLMNNLPVSFSHDYVDGFNLKAGGIEVYNDTSVQIRNCVIKNCYGQGAGGVFFCGNNFYMSNTKIFDCYGVDGPGGLAIGTSTVMSVTFDTQQPNSIYNNTGAFGMDLYMAQLSIPVDIVLDTFSVMMTEPDNFFFQFDESIELTFTVQNAYFDLINHDLYVSTTGSDTNTGLSPESPLKSIYLAAKILAQDSLNPKAIHLAPGLYTVDDANQYFPLTLKSYTSLIGSTEAETIFDFAQTTRYYLDIFYQRNIKIENIKFTAHTTNWYPLSIVATDNVSLRNLDFTGNFGADLYGSRIRLVYCDNVICEGCVFKDGSNINWDNLGLEIDYCNEVSLSGLIFDNMYSRGEMGARSCLAIWQSDVSFTNSIISNSSSDDGTIFFFENESNPNVKLIMTNMLFINNVTHHPYGAPFYIKNIYQSTVINNCTVAYNNGGLHRKKVLFVIGGCDINSSIFYNPVNDHDVLFSNSVDDVSYNVNINNSLLKHSFVAMDSSCVQVNEMMTLTDPMFLGTMTEAGPPSEPLFYHLSSFSPCINMGLTSLEGQEIPPYDLAGNARVWDGRIDMGCFEYGAPSVHTDDPENLPVQDNIVISTYPNPVYYKDRNSAIAKIDITLPVETKLSPLIEIYNLKGQKVKTLRPSPNRDNPSSKSTRNSYSILFNCEDDNNTLLATGIYIVRVTSGKFIRTAKITVLK